MPSKLEYGLALGLVITTLLNRDPSPVYAGGGGTTWPYRPISPDYILDRDEYTLEGKSGSPFIRIVTRTNLLGLIPTWTGTQMGINELRGKCKVLEVREMGVGGTAAFAELADLSCMTPRSST